MKIVIGLDPDASKHGVAIYEDGKLIELANLDLMRLIQKVSKYPLIDMFFCIEDVAGNSHAWNAHKVKGGINAKFKASQHLGMCKQAQIELQRALEFYSIQYKLVPISKAWKKDKKQFELATGWKGRSNEDTRSAAYFGFLGCK